jgi:hypothetical protein
MSGDPVASSSPSAVSLRGIRIALLGQAATLKALTLARLISEYGGIVSHSLTDETQVVVPVAGVSADELRAAIESGVPMFSVEELEQLLARSARRASRGDEASALVERELRRVLGSEFAAFVNADQDA